jgi:hypothetical protein
MELLLDPRAEVEWISFEVPALALPELPRNSSPVTALAAGAVSAPIASAAAMAELRRRLDLNMNPPGW